MEILNIVWLTEIFPDNAPNLFLPLRGNSDLSHWYILGEGGE